MTVRQGKLRGRIWLLLGVCYLGAGCQGVPLPAEVAGERDGAIPAEHQIAPPDVLVLNAWRVVPRPPYRIQTLDLLTVQVNPALPEHPLAGTYVVEPDGKVNLGSGYGTVPVVNLSVTQAEKAVGDHLKNVLKPGYQVSVSLAQARGLLQIRGEHPVQQDGTVRLGSYGSVPVAGLTVPEAGLAIEAHLTQFLDRPEVSVELSDFKGWVYHVITDGGG